MALKALVMEKIGDEYRLRTVPGGTEISTKNLEEYKGLKKYFEKHNYTYVELDPEMPAIAIVEMEI